MGVSTGGSAERLRGETKSDSCPIGCQIIELVGTSSVVTLRRGKGDEFVAIHAGMQIAMLIILIILHVVEE